MKCKRKERRKKGERRKNGERRLDEQEGTIVLGKKLREFLDSEIVDFKKEMKYHAEIFLKRNNRLPMSLQELFESKGFPERLGKNPIKDRFLTREQQQDIYNIIFKKSRKPLRNVLLGPKNIIIMEW